MRGSTVRWFQAFQGLFVQRSTNHDFHWPLDRTRTAESATPLKDRSDVNGGLNAQTLPSLGPSTESRISPLRHGGFHHAEVYP